jgi:hypothetical protein
MFILYTTGASADGGGRMLSLCFRPRGFWGYARNGGRRRGAAVTFTFLAGVCARDRRGAQQPRREV